MGYSLLFSPYKDRKNALKRRSYNLCDRKQSVSLLCIAHGAMCNVKYMLGLHV